MSKEEVLKMALEAGFQRMKMPWYQMYADQDQVIEFVDLLLERVAVEFEGKNPLLLYRSSYIANEIRALKTNNV